MWSVLMGRDLLMRTKTTMTKGFRSWLRAIALAAVKEMGYHHYRVWIGEAVWTEEFQGYDTCVFLCTRYFKCACHAHYRQERQRR